jgi:hypothetical protein
MCLHACYHAGMGQMTWRPSDALLERVRRAAGRQGRSMNDYVSAVLDVATNPDPADSDSQRLRQRLELAGLLAPSGHRRRRPSAGDVAQARAAAGTGTPLSDLVQEGR